MLLRDILAPSETLTSSYETYTIETKDGEEFSGVLVSDSATSVTLRQAGGIDQKVLRRDIVQLRGSPVSLMPDGFAEALTPQDCADLLGWLRMALSSSASE
jgi:putative heme-binding domain-containing protein